MRKRKQVPNTTSLIVAIVVGVFILRVIFKTPPPPVPDAFGDSTVA